MKKNERKLTEKELKRKEQFEILRADMQKNGYKEKTLTIGVLCRLMLEQFSLCCRL